MTTRRHAILGPGGVGGLIGAALGHIGAQVIVVARPGTLHPPSLSLQSSLLGNYVVPVQLAATLVAPVDVLWVAVKSQQLESALPAIAPDVVAGALIVPLLNGYDHLARLRERFPRSTVLAGAIRVEAERVAPGCIEHRGWHIPPDTGRALDPRFPRPSKPVQLAGPEGSRQRVEELAGDLEEAGIPCEVWNDEGYVLWSKLSILCPCSLAATALRGTFSQVKLDRELYSLVKQSAQEIVQVAAALGVQLDLPGILETIELSRGTGRSSMVRDAAAGLPIEVDAFTEPVLRTGTAGRIPVTATQRLRDLALAGADGWKRSPEGRAR